MNKNTFSQWQLAYNLIYQHYLFVNKLGERENMPDLRECWNGCEFIATSVPDMPPNHNLYVSSFATCALSQRSQYTSVHFYKFVSDDMWFSFCLLVALLFVGRLRIKVLRKKYRSFYLDNNIFGELPTEKSFIMCQALVSHQNMKSIFQMLNLPLISNNYLGL